MFRSLFNLLLLYCVGFPVIVRGAQVEVPSATLREVVLTGTQAQVVVQAIDSGSPVRWSLQSGGGVAPQQAWSSVVDSGVLRIRQDGVSDSLPLQLFLPQGLSLRVALLGGRIQLGSNVGPTHLRLIEGQIQTQKTQMPMQIFIQKGEASIADHRGSLMVESYGAKVWAANTEGSIEITNHLGETHVEKPQGSVTLRSEHGQGKVNSPQSVVHFQWGSGQLEVSDTASRCEGGLDDGNLMIKALADAEIEVKAGKGKVQVQLPQHSGAKLNLKTLTGDLIVPTPLKAARDAKFKIVRGRLSGDQSGSVYVLGDETSVIVR